MTELIALLSTGKGSWAEVSKLIKAKPWDKVFLITTEFGKNFSGTNETQLIICNFNSEITKLRDEIQQKLKEKITGLEVALHIGSGTGKEHMAVLSALLRLGVGCRLVTLSYDKFVEL